MNVKQQELEKNTPIFAALTKEFDIERLLGDLAEEPEKKGADKGK
ncbi:MAG TPA: hypothetical protein VJ870_00490 [Amycolatopsis sp.]|nr:hypothetical protein [Amycolatopsis sp.]